MTTIFTDDYSYDKVSIEIGDDEIGYVGRELILATENEREFRVKLSDDQLNELADVLLIAGYAPRKE